MRELMKPSNISNSVMSSEERAETSIEIDVSTSQASVEMTVELESMKK